MTGKDAVLAHRLGEDGVADVNVGTCYDELRTPAAVSDGAKQ